MTRRAIHDYRPAIQDQIAALLYAKPAPKLMPASVCQFSIAIEPMGKPRMTQRDKWAKRPAVLHYREFADKLRAAYSGSLSPTGVSWVAYFTMPESWSAKKKNEHRGTYHRSKPDRDNVDKGILDALFERDQCIAFGKTEKRWDDGNGARIELEISP